MFEKRRRWTGWMLALAMMISLAPQGVLAGDLTASAPEVQEADETRALCVSPLTPRQKAAAYAMVRDGRRLSDIMEESGMTPEEAVAWIRAGRFTEYVRDLARGFAEADAPTVWAALLRSAADGNVPATRLYFDLMERAQASGHRGEPVNLPATPSEELRALRESIFGGGAA